MRVLIFEPNSTGHHLHYVRHLIAALREFLPPQSVVAALPENTRSTPEYAAHLADVAEQAELDCWMPPQPQGALQAGAHGADMLAKSIARANAGWVLLPYGDGLSQTAGMRRVTLRSPLPRGVRAEALMMRGGFAYPQPTLKRTVATRLSWWAACRAPWSIIHILDPLVYEPLMRRGGQAAKRFRLMPDPVEVPESTDRAAARERLGIPTDGRYLACVGLIDRRKGIDLLLRAFADARLAPRDRLLLAGRHDRDIQQSLSGAYARLVQEGRIVSIDRTVKTEELLDAIVACDVMCALNRSHTGSVSTVIRAAAAGRPSLGHNYGWIGRIIPRFNLGWVCDAMDHRALTVRLHQSLDSALAFSMDEPAKRYVAYHRVENFQAHWTASLRQHLGLPQSKDLQNWEPAPALISAPRGRGEQTTTYV